MPYLPIVNAIAPNAPIGARLVIMRTMRKKVFDSSSIKPMTGFAGSPITASAVPNSMAISSTGRISPCVNAPTNVSGMMCMKKPASPSPCAACAA